MMIIRPIALDDLDAFEAFSMSSSTGITNLPKDRELLRQKILTSVSSFQSEVKKPHLEIYIFVMEDQETKELGGTCSIMAKTGVTHPLYFYRIETLRPEGKLLELPKELKIIRPVQYEEGPTEIASLFIAAKHRKEGLGRLLSFSRFLFIANFPNRFTETVVAEMRGVIDKLHCSPFWDCVGRHFYDADFDEIMDLQCHGHDFIPELLPEYPIYVDLLPFIAQDSLGKPHENTKPAMHMLVYEGFKFTNEVDLFDGGPKISAETQEIRTIKESSIANVHNITELTHDSPLFIVSNRKMEFRATYAKIQLLDKQNAVLEPLTAKALNVKPGDAIRYVPAA